MKKSFFVAMLVAVCNLCLVAVAVAADGAGKAQASGQASASSGTKRVRANAKGFDLDPKAQSGAQLGAGSRGGEASKTVLYAPNLGLAYSLHPTFQWQGQPGNLTFRLYDSDDNEVYETDVTGKNSLVYPEDAPALKPGDTYRWTVEGKAAGMTEPVSVRLKVVAGPERQQLDAELKKNASNARQRAQLFADNQIWYDAVADYSQLIAENPSDAKLREARADIYESVPQTKPLAAEDKAKAGK